MNNTAEINKLLTNAFQQECYLDDSEAFYKLQFPNIPNSSKFEQFKDKCEKFLSQYGIEIKTSTIISLETGKTFIVKINTVQHNKLLKKLVILSDDTQLHAAALQSDRQLLSILLHKGFNFNCKNIYGETLLQRAEQKKDIFLRKILLNRLLRDNLNIEKPDFCIQELDNYWDEQIKKRADKLSIQRIVDGATVDVRKITEEQK